VSEISIKIEDNGVLIERLKAEIVIRLSNFLVVYKDSYKLPTGIDLIFWTFPDY